MFSRDFSQGFVSETPTIILLEISPRIFIRYHPEILAAISPGISTEVLSGISDGVLPGILSKIFIRIPIIPTDVGMYPEIYVGIYLRNSPWVHSRI